VRYYKFPKWLKWLYPNAIWDFSFSNQSNSEEKSLYLTFDDGPNPITTNWILTELAKFNAKATFFCIGNNIKKQPNLFDEIKQQGHSFGNHTMHHLKGWKTKKKNYLEDIRQAHQLINSDLFRAPYGKLTPLQFKALKKEGFRVVFWSHITYDFDSNLATEMRLKKAIERAKDGAIIVFHDSDKAFNQLKDELPVLLKKWKEQGYQFKAI